MKIKLRRAPQYMWEEALERDYDEMPGDVEIPVRELLATQADVDRATVNVFMGRNFPVSPIRVKVVENNYLIWDGHHRVQSYLLRGIETIPAVIEFCKSREAEKSVGTAEVRRKP